MQLQRHVTTTKITSQFIQLPPNLITSWLLPGYDPIGEVGAFYMLAFRVTSSVCMCLCNFWKVGIYLKKKTLELVGFLIG